MKRISTHILDLVQGKPAAECASATGEAERLGRLAFAEFGAYRPRWPLSAVACRKAKSLSPGIYRLVFDTEKYFDAQKIGTLYPVVEVTFQVRRGRIAFSHSAALEPERIHNLPRNLSGKCFADGVT